MSKRIKILTPRIYEHSDFFHDAVDFARENSLNTNELCLELSHYLVDNFNKVWKIEKPRIYKKISDLEAKLEESEETINNLEQQCLICNKDKENEQLKQQLAESEIKLNRYPYKNDVIEEEYEDLKDAITFLMLNNIKDQEQLNYSIDVLCEKHKARIRDIENSICKIEQLEKHNQDKISFCIEKLEKVKDELTKLEQNYNLNLCDVKIYNFIDNQIRQLKEMK